MSHYSLQRFARLCVHVYMGHDADVIVIGSGIAGLCCAFHLSKKGKKVIVLESEHVIGGRTSSWTEKDGMQMESGLHKFLGIYRELPRVLKESGVDIHEMLTWVDAMELHNDRGERAYFTSSYRHPLKTARDYLGNNHYLPFGDKIKMLMMGIPGVLRSAMHPGKIDELNIADYARKFGISERTIKDTLHTLTSGVFFLPPHDYSVFTTFSPVVEAIKHGPTFRIGAFNGGMTEVMMNPIAEYVMKHGGAMHTDCMVTDLIVEDGKVTGVFMGNDMLKSNAVVLATSLHPAQQLIAKALPEHPWFKAMLQMKNLSAVTMQCELDAPIFEADHTHFSNTGVCCFGEQSHTTFKETKGRISTILYPPDELIGKNDDALYAYTETELLKAGVDIRGRVKRYRSAKHPYDFYALSPGAEKRRPTQKTPIPGFALAGDYTKQPFIASMEGAALSGKLAARAIFPEIK